MPDYDVMTFGETMLRYTPPGLRRLEQTTAFEVHVGGSEFNTAVGLTRLGLRVCWLSRLTRNPLGQMIVEAVARYRIDTSHVVWTDDGRVGTYYLEEGRPPRGSRVIYDRAHTAISTMSPDDLPRQLFQPEGARLLHLTGITFALGDGAAETALAALRLAKAAGWRVSFDLNYRAKLWSPAAAQATCEQVMREADVLFIARRDAHRVCEVDTDLSPAAMLDAMSQRYPQALLVMTMGGDGAIARNQAGNVVHQPVFQAEEVSRIGGGDAFSAGFLYGYLHDGDDANPIARALRWGAAVAALKYTITGDIPLIEYEEARRLVDEGDTGYRLQR